MTLDEARGIASHIERDAHTVQSVAIHEKSTMCVMYSWGSLTIRISDISAYSAYKKALELEDDSSFMRPNMDDV